MTPRRQGSGESPRFQRIPPGPRGLAREQVAEIQRARILAAMVEVSAEHGAAHVSVAHVVSRSGVSRRTFYELFSSAEDCLLATFDDALARASRYVLDGYDPGAGWAQRVRSALTGLLSFLDAERGAGRLLIVESLGAGAVALERRERVLAQMIALVDEGRTEAKSGSEPPPLTAEGIVGGVLSVLHSRLLVLPSSTVRGPGTKVPPPSPTPSSPPPSPSSSRGDSLLSLTGPLMSTIVLPYLGAAAARKELARPVPKALPRARRVDPNPLSGLQMRLTYRTVRVLAAIGELSRRRSPPSNRAVADAAGITDQGQVSKLLTRLTRLGLVENTADGLLKGGPNGWRLTQRGREVEGGIGEGGLRC